MAQLQKIIAQNFDKITFDDISEQRWYEELLKWRHRKHKNISPNIIIAGVIYYICLKKEVHMSQENVAKKLNIGKLNLLKSYTVLAKEFDQFLSEVVSIFFLSYYSNCLTRIRDFMFPIIMNVSIFTR